MKRLKLNKSHLRRLFYMILVILPAILTGNIYESIDNKAELENKLLSLNSIGSSLHLNIKNGQDYLAYNIYYMTSSSEFRTLDPTIIAKQAHQLAFFNDEIKNVYVIDSSNTIIYGINDNRVFGINETPHITSALNGTPSFYSTFYNNTPFLQFAYPIFEDETNSSVIGALIATINFDSIFTILESIDSDTSGTNAYIIDGEGMVLLDSDTHSFNRTTTRIDITRLQTQLDYDPISEFVSPDGETVHGVYFKIPQSKWTLLVTSPVSDGISILDFISYILGGLGAGSITTTEILRRRRDLNCLSDAPTTLLNP